MIQSASGKPYYSSWSVGALAVKLLNTKKSNPNPPNVFLAVSTNQMGLVSNKKRIIYHD